MKVIKNFKKLKESVDEFPSIKILDSEDIFVDLPLCIMEFNREYRDPYLYFGPETPIGEVMEKEALLFKTKGTKLFYFKKVEENRVKEVTKDEAEFSYRLPEEVPVEELAIINGQIG